MINNKWYILIVKNSINLFNFKYISNAIDGLIKIFFFKKLNLDSIFVQLHILGSSKTHYFYYLYSMMIFIFGTIVEVLMFFFRFKSKLSDVHTYIICIVKRLLFCCLSAIQIHRFQFGATNFGILSRVTLNVGYYLVCYWYVPTYTFS